MSWIKCSERMPEFGTPVLVYGLPRFSSSPMISTYVLDKYGWDCVGAGGYECEPDLRDEGITHWQSLPEPPND